MSNKKIDDMMENIVMSDDLKDKIRKETTEKGKVVKFRERSVKKIVLVACLCVAMLGTMTVVAAKNEEKIEGFFMDMLGYNSETQQMLEEEGLVQNMEVAYNSGDIVAVTHDGITVAVKETITDKSVIQILVQVRAEKGIKLDEYCYFNEFSVKGVSMSSGGMECGVVANDELEGEWYIVSINNAENNFKTGDIVEVTFHDLLRANWDTEVLCELKDGATGIVDGEEYVMKRVGHADEIDNGGEELFEPDHWYSKYGTLAFDIEQYAYAFIRVSDGEVYNPDDLIVRHANDGKSYLLQYRGGGTGYDTISDEEWTLSWKLNINEVCSTFPVNETIECNNLCYYIDSVQITPLSLKVVFSGEASGSLKYTPLDIKVHMKDGVVITAEESVSLITGQQGEWYGFRYAIDLDNIEKISIEGKDYFLGE